VQQRLGGNAADVEASAAQRLAAFHAGGLQAQLRRADRADIAAGAGADEDHVVVVVQPNSSVIPDLTAGIEPGAGLQKSKGGCTRSSLRLPAVKNMGQARRSAGDGYTSQIDQQPRRDPRSLP
jgi:hypothetical protein